MADDAPYLVEDTTAPVPTAPQEAPPEGVVLPGRRGEQAHEVGERLEVVLVQTVDTVDNHDGRCGYQLARAGCSRKRVLVDVAHGQRFWNDPASREEGQGDIDRARYLRDQLRETTSALSGELGYVTEELTPARLAECDVLFIHVPTRPYGSDEVKTIADYVEGGGSLFVVLEVDYWSKLEDTNLNEIVGRFGLEYGGSIPGEKSGGYTRAGLVTSERLSIPYHGGRAIRGGTFFCFTDQGAEHGGRIVAMGDGMVSLYMNSWEDVSDYQCAEFMRDTLEWLLQ